MIRIHNLKLWIEKAVDLMGGLDGIWGDKRDESFVRGEFIRIYKEITSVKMVTGGEIKLLGEGK